MRQRVGFAMFVLVLCTPAFALAADVPIIGLKLIVVDRTIAAGSAKAIFAAKDGAVVKGVGTDPTQIEATLDLAYDSVSGAFTMPQGSGWLLNKSTIAKYVNKAAPTGGAVKVAVIRPGKLVKVVGRSLGDASFPITKAPQGAVYAVYTIVNGSDTTRLCTQFAGCEHKIVAGGTGSKLVCRRNSTGDSACLGVAPCRANRFVDQGSTVLDTCTNLEWEKKTTAVDSGVNYGDLHDVDNRYRWAGWCSIAYSKNCQPNLAAETACKAHTDMAEWSDGCEQCTAAEGECTQSDDQVVPPLTVWEWLSQLNAANYAGHDDWRLPSESACNSCVTALTLYTNSCAACDSHELETLLPSPAPCGATPCIAPIFGPTVADLYWSGTPWTQFAWEVSFLDGDVFFALQTSSLWVRAVRDAS